MKLSAYWRKRLKNKIWWAATISNSLLAVQALAALLGYQFDGQKYLAAANILLSLAVQIGIIVDPTTPGLKDGE